MPAESGSEPRQRPTEPHAAEDAAPAVPCPETGSAELSPREMEVLALIADYRTNGEIAAALVISKETVSSHLNRIMEKTGIHDRRELARRQRAGAFGQ